ncbi:hypothetical protein [Nocardia brasiliensis]|uniref:hypothetical protein n=1 Tax=Nocardia brasiliensis TaxID=37326 RepID=UPI003671963D
MDPVSLGIAAAALLASKFGEEVAQNAASNTWSAVKRLREAIAAKLSGDSEINTDVTAFIDNSTPEARTVIAERVAAAARSDPGFANEVERLVAAARRDRQVDMFVAQAYDDARQVNISGDNDGTINIS